MQLKYFKIGIFLSFLLKYAILEKWIFENFQVPFYDDVIYKDDSHLFSNEVVSNFYSQMNSQ